MLNVFISEPNTSIWDSLSLALLYDYCICLSSENLRSELKYYATIRFLRIDMRMKGSPVKPWWCIHEACVRNLCPETLKVWGDSTGEIWVGPPKMAKVKTWVPLHVLVVRRTSLPYHFSPSSSAIAWYDKMALTQHQSCDHGLPHIHNLLNVCLS